MEQVAEVSPHSPSAPPGYELLDEIGRGGMGVVYRARDLALDRDVAVKLLQERYPADSASARRFLDEAHITGQLQHPGIPAVHQIGALPDGRPFLAMKLIKGRTLDELLKGRADPTAERGRFVAVFEQVCQAVGYAHAHKIIHRDLKPANVMVGAFGEVQVMDWGLAKVLTSRREQPHRPDADTAPGTEIRSTRGLDLETQAGSLLGTPAFMPPEQAIGAVDQIDARSDVFGLGALLCMILTGQPPYVGADTESTRQLAARAKLDDAFARLAACGAEPELVALCRRCLSAEKADRPSDAGEVAGAVAELRAAAEERARRAELDRARAEVQAAEQRKRRKVQLALAVAVGLLLCAGGAFAWWQDKRTTAERERRGRNADAVTTLLGQCEEALRADDAAKASLTLEQAEKRVAEGGAERLADRFARCRVDLNLLHELDASDQFRWTPIDRKYPDKGAITARWRTITAEYAVVPDETPADEAASRVSKSLVRDRLLALLDLWLVWEPSPWLRAVLHAADADPYRDAVREAITTKDQKRVAELAERPEAMLQPARFAAALGQSTTAIAVIRRQQILEIALRRRPGDLNLVMGLSWTYPRAGANERLRWFQIAAAVHPQNILVHINLSEALREKNDLAGAIAECKEAIRLDPNLPHAHARLASHLQQKRDLDEAIAEYKEAIRLDPQDAGSHSGLAMILATGPRGVRDGKQAIKYATRACELSQRPNFWMFHTLAAAYAESGDFDNAIEYQKKAIGLPKSDLELAITRANFALYSQKQPYYDPFLSTPKYLDRAIAECREAISRNPKDARAHYNLGEALRGKKNLDEAIVEYREAIRLDPKMVATYNDLGNELRAKGDLDGAIAVYREVIRLNPKNDYSHYILGLALQRANNMEAAITSFNEAKRLNPKGFGAHHGLGDALAYKKDLAGAIAEYKEAIRLEPKYAPAHLGLGLALRAKGDLDGAIAEFREIIRLDPKNSSNQNTLAWFLAVGPDGLRDGKRAVEHAIRACELSQWKNPDFIDTLAAAYAEAGDFDWAIEYQKKCLPHLKPTDRKQAEQRLALYTQKRPYRDPDLAPARPREVAPIPRAVAR